MPEVKFSHVMKVCLDAEVTAKFYADVFGFELDWRVDDGLDERFKPLTEIPEGISGHILMYRKGDVRLEFADYKGPVGGSTVRKPMNTLGVSHLSFRVEDFEGTLDAIRAAGGTVLDHTRVNHPNAGDYIMTLDPDGHRIELMPMTPLKRD